MHKGRRVLYSVLALHHRLHVGCLVDVLSMLIELQASRRLRLGARLAGDREMHWNSS